MLPLDHGENTVARKLAEVARKVFAEAFFCKLLKTHVRGSARKLRGSFRRKRKELPENPHARKRAEAPRKAYSEATHAICLFPFLTLARIVTSLKGFGMRIANPICIRTVERSAAEVIECTVNCWYQTCNSATERWYEKFQGSSAEAARKLRGRPAEAEPSASGPGHMAMLNS